MTTITVNTKNLSQKRTAVRLLQNALNREREILKAGLKKTEKNLKQFEKKYDMSSEKFYGRYQNGKFDDRNDFIDWACEYHIYQSLCEQLEVLKELRV